MQRAIDCVNRHLEDSDFDQPQFLEDMGTSKSTLYKKDVYKRQRSYR